MNRRATLFLLALYLTFLPIFTTPLLPVKPVYALNPTTVRFLYDGVGARVAKIENGKTTLYAQGIEKVVETGEVTKYYGLAGKTIAVKDQSGINYIVADHLGSTRSLTNSSGTKISEAKYYPYGQLRSQPAPLLSRQYTGQINDSSTQLYFYNARYYNPVTANFTQADMGGGGANKYAYVSGNPINFSDPSGNDGEDTVNPNNDCVSNPLSSSCITLGPIDTYIPIQATQPLTAQPCYSQEECKANQEFAIAAYAFFGLIVGGGAIAEIGAPALFETVTMLYVTGSNLWNQFASNHPRLALGIDLSTEITIGVSPSGISAPMVRSDQGKVYGRNKDYLLDWTAENEVRVNMRPSSEAPVVRDVSGNVFGRASGTANVGGRQINIYGEENANTLVLHHELGHATTNRPIPKTQLDLFREECHNCKSTYEWLIASGYQQNHPYVQSELNYWRFNYEQYTRLGGE